MLFVTSQRTERSEGSFILISVEFADSVGTHVTRPEHPKKGVWHNTGPLKDRSWRVGFLRKPFDQVQSEVKAVISTILLKTKKRRENNR